MTFADQQEVYELTPTQQAMLIYALYAPPSAAYFEQFCYRYRGPLNTQAFAAAWQRVIDRHPILRTSFRWEDGDHPLQVVNPRAELPLQLLDWRNLSTTTQPEQLTKFLVEDRERGFDLAQAPLIRVSLIQTAEDAFYFVLSNHHIILDGWSMGLVRREASQIYQALVAGEEIDLPPAPLFREYVEWLNRQNHNGAEGFWRRELVGFAAPNSLPIDRTPRKLPGPDEVFREQQICLPEQLTAELQSCAKKNRLTMSTMVQAAWAVLLSRYCGTEDVAFGITVSGRPYELADSESMVGLLINTLPVRVQMSAEEFASACFQKLQSKIAGLREHEHISLKQIHAWSELPVNTSLFESLVVFENFAGHDSHFELGGALEIEHAHLARTNYPLAVVVNPGAEMQVRAIYHRSRFETEAIRRMLGHLTQILQSFVVGLDQPISSFEILTESERHTLLVDWNSNTGPSDDRPVHQRFEEQAVQTPEALAIEHEAQSLTYAELNARANQLARYLSEAGVGPERLVGICLERSIDMIVAVLAVLKAGGAYLPLDPAYPKDRLAFMLEDARPVAVVTKSDLARSLPTFGREAHFPLPLGEGPGERACDAISPHPNPPPKREGNEPRIVFIDREWPAISQNLDDNLADPPLPEDLAYAIYTSGSTGKPKGVMIEHRALASFASAASEEYSISRGDRVLQFASLSFDTSAEEIYGALTRGATLVLRTDAMLSSPAEFLQSCGELGITVLDLPTAYWHYLTASLNTENLSVPEPLRLVILGGEQAQPARVASWLERAGDKVRLVNTYGPTETTVVATSCELSGNFTASSVVPIGRPIRNAAAYVLDRFRSPVPVEVPGELYLGGNGVARGYLNRPELTAEKFIPNPFGDGRLYRTGDVVRYLPDGKLEFLGRVDNQVKIRGFRVELEEIEQIIRTHQNVSDAVVVAHEDADGDKRLFAYVVPNAASQSLVTTLRSWLKGKLPPHMLPAAFVIIDALPFMPNGKLDRQSLPDPGNERPEVDEIFEAPTTLTEKIVAKVWRDTLKLERVGIRDNFFELGGHSLLAARVVSELRRNFNFDLNLIDVFNASTIAELAGLIYRRQTGDEKNGDLKSLLSELERLSDEEAKQLLAEELQTVDGVGNRPVLGL